MKITNRLLNELQIVLRWFENPQDESGSSVKLKLQERGKFTYRLAKSLKAVLAADKTLEEVRQTLVKSYLKEQTETENEEFQERLRLGLTAVEQMLDKCPKVSSDGVSNLISNLIDSCGDRVLLNEQREKCNSAYKAVLDEEIELELWEVPLAWLELEKNWYPPTVLGILLGTFVADDEEGMK